MPPKNSSKAATGAPWGNRFSTQQSLSMQDKVERFQAGMRDDIVDLLT